MTKRIGIFSGTFDPIHAGHIGFALAAIKKAKLDKVYLLVENKPRYKSGVTHVAHRLAMAKLATAQHPRMGVLEMPDQQLSVAKTLPRLRQRFPKDKLLLLVGSDLLEHLSSWPHIDRLLVEMDLAVARRLDVSAKSIREIANKLPTHPKNLYIFLAPSPLVSSGRIRQAISNNRSSKDVLPSIQAYIADNWLYVSPASNAKRT